MSRIVVATVTPENQHAYTVVLSDGYTFLSSYSPLANETLAFPIVAGAIDYREVASRFGAVPDHAGVVDDILARRNLRPARGVEVPAPQGW
jgi:hypothetical protein